MLWYEDEDIGIYFDKTPITAMRNILPSMTKEEKKNVTKYPFINKRELTVILKDFKNKKRYYFKVFKGYKWDGASIPSFAWAIIGAKTDPRFRIPSMIHDMLCENHKFVNYDRYFADKVFERLLFVAGVPDIKRWAMFHSVDNFQKFQGWSKKDE